MVGVGNFLFLLQNPPFRGCLHQDGLCELSASEFLVFEVRLRHLFRHNVCA
jgi:hypothetical protein